MTTARTVIEIEEESVKLLAKFGTFEIANRREPFRRPGRTQRAPAVWFVGLPEFASLSPAYG
jgi:hypothetical protein